MFDVFYAETEKEGAVVFQENIQIDQTIFYIIAGRK